MEKSGRRFALAARVDLSSHKTMGSTARVVILGLMIDEGRHATFGASGIGSSGAPRMSSKIFGKDRRSAACCEHQHERVSPVTKI